MAAGFRDVQSGRSGRARGLLERRIAAAMGAPSAEPAGPVMVSAPVAPAGADQDPALPFVLPLLTRLLDQPHQVVAKQALQHQLGVDEALLEGAVDLARTALAQCGVATIWAYHQNHMLRHPAAPLSAAVQGPASIVGYAIFKCAASAIAAAQPGGSEGCVNVGHEPAASAFRPSVPPAARGQSPVGSARKHGPRFEAIGRRGVPQGVSRWDGRTAAAATLRQPVAPAAPYPRAAVDFRELELLATVALHAAAPRGSASQGEAPHRGVPLVQVTQAPGPRATEMRYASPVDMLLGVLLAIEEKFPGTVERIATMDLASLARSFIASLELHGRLSGSLPRRELGEGMALAALFAHQLNVQIRPNAAGLPSVVMTAPPTDAPPRGEAGA